MDGPGRELRLALGMRGGVSLAVWIGGACVELDELRRATGFTEEEPDFWGALTALAGYDSVIVDVMAGASAGGLNGVLFSACQAYGVPFSAIRSTWIDVGSTEQLVRRSSTERSTAPGEDATPAELQWLSLFRGDRHMYRSIVSALTKLVDAVDDSDRPPRPPRMDLRLSATHVEPIVRPVRSPTDEVLTERRFATGFRFRASDREWLDNDYPPYVPAGAAGRRTFAGHVSRLALAARTTSSYPGAFEAASIRSARPDRFAEAPAEPSPGFDVDMGGIFADRTTGPPFAVADGGIVDNIPLGRALDAVAAAPAAGPTDRYLLYLHPGAPTAPVVLGPDASMTEARRRSVVAVLKAAIGARVLGEDISGDIAAVDAHNRSVERALAVRRATFGTMTGRPALVAGASAGRASYLLQRADEDTRLVTSLLEDPLGFLGDDPFPARVGDAVVDEARWRSPLEEIAPAQQGAIADQLYDALSDRLPTWRDGAELDGEVFVTGARPLVRVTHLLLEWARHVERHDPSAASEVKKVLYRVLAFCEAGIERPRRLAWVALLATAPRDDLDAATTISTALACLGRLTRHNAVSAEQVCRALIDGDDGSLEDLLGAGREHLDEICSGAWTTDGAEDGPDPVDLRRTIAETVLVELAERLRGSVVPPSPQSGPLEPGEYLHRVLSGDTPITVATLAALEVTCYPEFATGLPGRRPVSFVRLSAANPTPLAPQFTALGNDAAEQGLWWDPENREWDDQGGIHVGLKLAGNELANFSAFLRDGWRANDWMWGRLDAVPTLVDLVVTPESLRRAGHAAAERRALLEQLITGGEGEIGEIGAELWSRHGNAIATELARIDDPDEDGTARLEHTRTALVARRQWEILDEELPGEGPVRDRITGYRVGAERVTDPEFRSEIRARLREITDAASRVLVATAAANGSTRWGRPGKTNLRGNLARLTVKHGARLGTRRLIR